MRRLLTEANITQNKKGGIACATPPRKSLDDANTIIVAVAILADSTPRATGGILQDRQTGAALCSDCSCSCIVAMTRNCLSLFFTPKMLDLDLHGYPPDFQGAPTTGTLGSSIAYLSNKVNSHRVHPGYWSKRALTRSSIGGWVINRRARPLMAALGPKGFEIKRCAVALLARRMGA